jgi:hypothetical protein
MIRNLNRTRTKFGISLKSRSAAIAGVWEVIFSSKTYCQCGKTHHLGMVYTNHLWRFEGWFIVAFTTLLVLKGEEEKTSYYHHQHRYKPTAGSCHIVSACKRPTWWFILLSSKWVISGLYPLTGKVLLIHLAEQQKAERFTIWFAYENQWDRE